MSSVGINRRTGKLLTGWDHVEQSISVILTTPIGSRVMRREFGSRLFELVDAPMNDATILEVYVACAEAIEKWEPRFRLSRVLIGDADAQGRISLALFGTYYPRGHLGDFSVEEQKSATVAARIFQ